MWLQNWNQNKQTNKNSLPFICTWSHIHRRNIYAFDVILLIFLKFNSQYFPFHSFLFLFKLILYKYCRKKARQWRFSAAKNKTKRSLTKILKHLCRQLWSAFLENFWSFDKFCGHNQVNNDAKRKVYFQKVRFWKADWKVYFYMNSRLRQNSRSKKFSFWM